jgi:TRAP-type C4-dicarboxylate transport system substrate-binding protein
MLNIRFRNLLVAAGAAATIALAAAPAIAQQQPIVMKFATLTINDVQHEYLKNFKAELEKVTNNRIRVELYPAAQLGGAPRQTEGVRLGTIEAASGPAELFVGADPRFQVLAMAGLFKDNDHARRVLDVPAFRKIWEDFTATRGMINIGLTVYDQQLIALKAPAAKLNDLSGRRLRVLASASEQASISALGAAPVPMSLPEVLPALQQGAIDGVSSVLGVFVAFRYYDAASHVLDTALWHLIPINVVSKVWFDRLPADLQKAIVETGAKLEADNYKWQVARIADDRKEWMAKGGRFTKLSAAEQQEAEKRVTGAVQSVLAKHAPSKALYDQLKAIADKVN